MKKKDRKKDKSDEKLTKPLVNARSYSTDSRAVDKKSNTGIFPFSVYVFNCDFNGTDLKLRYRMWLEETKEKEDHQKSIKKVVE